MTESVSTPLPETPPAPGIGRILAGVAVIVAWTLAHVILFYLFFASGAVIDILLSILRKVFFPAAGTYQAVPDPFAWTGFLQAGLILAGAAGIPLGLRIFWRGRRKVLMRAFWIALVAGAGFEICAFYILLSNSLAIPS